MKFHHVIKILISYRHDGFLKVIISNTLRVGGSIIAPRQGSVNIDTQIY